MTNTETLGIPDAQFLVPGNWRRAGVNSGDRPDSACEFRRLTRDKDDPVRDLTLRINLSGTTAALVAVGEFVRVRTGFARWRRRTPE